MSLTATIGHNVRTRRAAASLTAEELGAAMGLEGQSARTSVWRWERGQKMSLETVERLAFALDCEAWELCKWGGQCLSCGIDTDDPDAEHRGDCEDV